MSKLKNENGVALVVTLFFVVILLSLSGVFLLRVIGENRIAHLERENTKVFYVSQAGSQAALEQMDVLINTYLLNTIASANPNGVISYAQTKVSQADGIGWLTYAVRYNNVPVLAQNGDQAEYSGNGTLGGMVYQYDIVITEKEDPAVSGPDAWDFAYSYVIEASAPFVGMDSTVKVSGDFTVQLQRDNFAKYALFTNNQQLPNGTNVWFTDKTNFAGPVHTNDRFNFALNPSGTFQQSVSQVQQTARFYNNGFPVLLDDSQNGTTDVPTFDNGFDRNQGSVTLNSPVSEQDMIDQATGNQTYSTDGIYVPESGGALTGGIYVRGSGDVSLSVNSGLPVYTITQGSTTKTITVDSGNNQTSVFDGTSTTVYNGLPDGVDDVGTLIFVEGAVNNLGGTVQADSKVTVASSNDVVINNHVQYESYTAAVGTPGQVGYVPPSATGYTNLLGIVSWQGDVRIGTSAPNDVQVHGTVLASNGIFQVDNYNDQGVGARGTATLLGGAITDNYGAFGLFNGGTGQQLSGYGREFVYDDRMLVGEAPPYFPSLDTFIAFTNDLTDKIVWQEGE